MGEGVTKPPLDLLGVARWPTSATGGGRAPPLDLRGGPKATPNGLGVAARHPLSLFCFWFFFYCFFLILIFLKK